jgi:hypothetical protein
MRSTLPAPSGQDVLAQVSVQDVGAVVADHRLSVRVAGQVDRRFARGVDGPQNLDVLAGLERVADRRHHRVGVGVAAPDFDGPVARVVDMERVAAAVAGDHVRTGPAVENVGASIAVSV